MAEGPTPRPQMQIGWALTQQDVENTATFLGVTPAHIWAVVSVETRGYGFFADRTPAILFERHYFSRLTGGAFDASHGDISNPRFGGYGASSQQYSRLARAAALDYDAALKSASWGIGQVMGANAENLDYSSVREFVELARKSEGEQLTAMARFIDRNGLKRPMQRRDWTFFARRYNGPSFAKNKYDTRLEAAYQLYSTSGRLPDWKVRQAQVYLVYFGELDARGVDGLIGRKTRAALNDFFDSIGRTDIDTSGLQTVNDDLLSILSNRAGQLPDAWPLTAPGAGSGGGGVGVV
ncbi:MAG: N-acetylmuramidase family protein [Rhodobacteraceae bacterium]|nr:N-acetylmuramidase family protein [Paracoccaceae bacterium]